MELPIWLEILIGSGLITGLIEFFKWRYTSKEEKKSIKLDNEAKQQELAHNELNAMLEKWQSISEKSERDLEYYRTCLQDKDATIREKEERIDAKDREIAEHKDNIDRLRSLLVKAKCTRCDVVACPDRKPPLGYVDVPLEDIYKDQ